MRKNFAALRTNPIDPKLGSANEDNMFDESSTPDRIAACKFQFRSWEVHQARFGNINVGADPESPLDNAQVTVHLKTSVGSVERDLDLIWVMLCCRSDQSPHPIDHWGMDIYSVRPLKL
jgi:hypothetical protein